jgi:hypothetical protein
MATYLRHKTSGEVWAVASAKDGTVLHANGPLYHDDIVVGAADDIATNGMPDVAEDVEAMLAADELISHFGWPREEVAEAIAMLERGMAAGEYTMDGLRNLAASDAEVLALAAQTILSPSQD